MNHLIRRGLMLASPRYACLSRRVVVNYSTSNSDDPNKLKQTIESNEDDYYSTVKSSFDRLQKSRNHETVEEKRARLMYQSRKRGTTENGLILANFSARYLHDMTVSQLDEYDRIINGLHNEWDLYYWLTDAVPTPNEFASSQVLKLMKKFCSNENKHTRIAQPEIN